MNASRPTTGYCEGVRVLDLSRWVAGEFAARLFARLRCRCDQDRATGQGSLTRHGPFPGDLSEPEASALFLNLNLNKRSIALDLTDEADGRCCSAWSPPATR